ncbi:hypothetical protein AWJ20_1356 [Sugiyamaella lignohabitans]|uniref:Phosphatidylinositol-specific phospholipase C X domain-containing protein n=1 Tax=Sugiyamaella lignohabitans TaxID=796027 RepID=A0A161HJV2_9ASCO|nr:uncharacterized protein AWJ20_1356 [Sugiyamaella lignohabitans]ANB13077.1 hypothetical protein AWJ20_1356 [Sugiyamaella lignohabitans]
MNLADSDLANWMQKLPDELSLAKIALPGTHNSAACYLTLPSVQCQGSSISDQLLHGVRFLDIRVAAPFFTGCGAAFGSGPDDLQVIHGNFPVKLPFPAKLQDTLVDVYSFLQEHPSETVFVSIKAEGPFGFDKDDFANIIWERYINPSHSRWFLSDQIPKAGDVRGKAVLFRRFGVPDDNRKGQFGIEAAWWKYNTTEDNQGDLAVQDWCEVMAPEDIAKKRDYISQHLNRAKDYNSTDTSEPKLFLNYCSGSNFWNPQCWPQRVSTAISTSDFHNDLGAGCGIVIIDYAESNDWATVRKLVESNIRT